MSDDFLKEFITEEIYLVEDDKETSVNPQHNSDILVIIPGDTSRDEMGFLEKIFASIKVPLKRLTISQEDQSPEHSFQWIFYFGTGSEELPTFQWYQQDGKEILNAHRLNDISSNREMKMQLWKALQQSALP